MRLETPILFKVQAARKKFICGEKADQLLGGKGQGELKWIKAQRLSCNRGHILYFDCIYKCTTLSKTRSI